MIFYNVTLNIEESAHDQWLEWMKAEHLPAVMATGMFESYRFARLITKQPGETGITYSIQYACQSMALYHRYEQEFAPDLKAETQRLFDGKFVAFRSLMEEV